jgi:hypothetical protein
MGILAEIKQQLLAGQQPADLVKRGYKKSSVYYVAKRLWDAQLGMPGLPVGDEVVELKRRREIVRLQKEIAELESAKEKVPERLARLERKFDAFCRAVEDGVDTLFYRVLRYVGYSDTEAMGQADGWFRKHCSDYWKLVD